MKHIPLHLWQEEQHKQVIDFHKNHALAKEREWQWIAS